MWEKRVSGELRKTRPAPSETRVLEESSPRNPACYTYKDSANRASWRDISVGRLTCISTCVDKCESGHLYPQESFPDILYSRVTLMANIRGSELEGIAPIRVSGRP